MQNEANIFVGENGMGKTTILNCLYGVLSGRIEILANTAFNEIDLYFAGEEKPLQLLKKDLLAYMDEPTSFGVRRRRLPTEVFESFFSKQELNELKTLAENGNLLRADLRPYIFRVSEAFHVSPGLAYREIRFFLESEAYDTEKANIESVVIFKKGIEKYVTDEVLYFPTYRRIEEDMSMLGLDTDNDRNIGIKSRLIQFGMSDVERVIETTLETIKDAAITGFNKMTGVLLHQYVCNQVLKLDNTIIDIEQLNIALNRIGNQIDEVDKDKIRDLAESGELYNNRNVYLLNLVHNLIGSYNKQSYYDEKIKKFRDVCNGYLEGKQYVYNESELTLRICKNSNGKSIQLKNLSSGEKQIISVFSKLYLEGKREDQDKRYIILFDEPELSLSIKWQAHFLPDIMRSKKCNKLIAVTHSPFIFENEFDDLATDMGMCITEVDNNDC